MIITPAISRRMVAAKRRLALARASAPIQIEAGGRVPVPRASAAKWTIEIRDGEHSDRVRFRLYRTPWPNLWLWRIDGQTAELVSTRSVAERLRVLFTHAA